MTCREMDDVISSRSGDSALEPRSAEHLVHCERCRSLTLLLDKPRDEPRSLESLLRRILTGILRDLKPVQPLAPSYILFLGCAIVFLTVVAVGTLLLGMNGWGALSVVQRIVVFLTLAASAVLLSVSLVQQIVPGSKHACAPAFLVVTIPAVLMMTIAAVFRSRPESHFVASGWMCLRNGIAFAIPAAFLLGLVLRRGAILFPKVFGALAGGLAGLIGLSVLEINCPNLNLSHILVWHGGVLAISTAAGALLGAAVESMDARVS